MDKREFRIWQRVQEGPRQEALGEVLYHLAERSAQAWEDYRRMKRGCSEKLPEMLARWEQENLACIRGLFLLSTGRPLSRGKTLPGEGGRDDGWHLYRRALEQLQEYTSLSAQPHFGTVFGEMARRQEKICEGIVRILGENKEKYGNSVRQ